MKPETDTILTMHRTASIAWNKAYDAIYFDGFRALPENERVRRYDVLSAAIAATEAIEAKLVDLIERSSLVDQYRANRAADKAAHPASAYGDGD